MEELFVILKPVLAFVLWCGYACMEGNREADFFHLILSRADISKKDGKYLHIIWTIQRALVLGIVALLTWKAAIACALVFPFIHDGSEYSSRNDLNPLNYPKRWFDQSTTSTAFLTKFETPVVRTVLAVLGIAWLVTSFFI